MSIKCTVTCKKESWEKLKQCFCNNKYIGLSCCSIIFLGIPMLIFSVIIATVAFVVGIPVLSVMMVIALIKLAYQALTGKHSEDCKIILTENEDEHKAQVQSGDQH